VVTYWSQLRRFCRNRFSHCVKRFFNCERSFVAKTSLPFRLLSVCDLVVLDTSIPRPFQRNVLVGTETISYKVAFGRT